MAVSSSLHGFPLRICSSPFPKAFQRRQHCLNMSLHFLFLHNKTAEELGGGSFIPLCSLGLCGGAQTRSLTLRHPTEPLHVWENWERWPCGSS